MPACHAGRRSRRRRLAVRRGLTLDEAEHNTDATPLPLPSPIRPVFRWRPAPFAGTASLSARNALTSRARTASSEVFEFLPIVVSRAQHFDPVWPRPKIDMPRRKPVRRHARGPHHPGRLFFRRLPVHHPAPCRRPHFFCRRRILAGDHGDHIAACAGVRSIERPSSQPHESVNQPAA